MYKHKLLQKQMVYHFILDRVGKIPKSDTSHNHFKFLDLDYYHE